jgi:AcrR family transcriptional regulator
MASQAEEEGASGLPDAPNALAAPLVYDSEAIRARRRRILRETRRLIGERGMEGFTIRALCTRADVAQRTLYNAFGNKDRLIAIAIKEAYEEYNRTARYRAGADTLAGMLERLVTVNRRNFRVRNYTRAVASLYFAPATHHDVWQALQDMTFVNLRIWLAALKASGDLADQVDLDALAALIANVEYATINDWAQGRLTNGDYIARLVENVLVIVIGNTVGATRDEAAALRTRLRRDPADTIRTLAAA